jgi:hypothetical protein
MFDFTPVNKQCVSCGNPSIRAVFDKHSEIDATCMKCGTNQSLTEKEFRKATREMISQLITCIDRLEEAIGID